MPPTNCELQVVFVNPVCDLLAFTVGATRDGADLAQTRGVSADRLSAMKGDIRKMVNDPHLSVHGVAVRYGVGIRYVQRIFGEGGSTFTQYVPEQRLVTASKALRRRAWGAAFRGNICAGTLGR